MQYYVNKYFNPAYRYVHFRNIKHDFNINMIVLYEGNFNMQISSKKIAYGMQTEN